MRSKVIVLFLSMCMVGLVANAQILTSTSKLVTKVKKPPFKKTFYVAAGGSLNTATNKYYSFNPGYELALGYEYNLKRNREFGSQLGLELGLTSQGWKYEQLGIKHDVLSGALFISPYYSYRVGLGSSKKSALEPFVGAFACLLLDTRHFNESSQSVGYQPSVYLYGGVGKDDLNGGITTGLRYWLSNRFSLDLIYRQGLFDFANNYLSGTRYSYNETSKQWNSHHFEEHHNGFSSSIILRLGVKLNK